MQSRSYFATKNNWQNSLQKVQNGEKFEVAIRNSAAKRHEENAELPRSYTNISLSNLCATRREGIYFLCSVSFGTTKHNYVTFEITCLYFLNLIQWLLTLRRNSPANVTFSCSGKGLKTLKTWF